MIKKLLLLVAFATSIFAANPNFTLSYTNDNKIVSLTLEDRYLDHPNANDWIGIYKQGASNDWANVEQWIWSKNLGNYQDSNTYFFELNIADGAYDVRYFLNNSFTTYKSLPITVTSVNQAPYLRIEFAQKDNILFYSSRVGTKSWVGVYKKGVSNSWNNVEAWTWVREAEGIDRFQTIGRVNLDPGTYELRLFYNNSYNMETKIEFTIEGEAVNETIFANNGYTYNDREKLYVSIIQMPNDYTKKDWVGVFPQGAIHTLNNLVAWRYVNDENIGILRGRVSLVFYNKSLLARGQNVIYDVVYFKNDSYTQVGETGRIAVTY